MHIEKPRGHNTTLCYTAIHPETLLLPFTFTQAKLWLQIYLLQMNVSIRIISDICSLARQAMIEPLCHLCP